MKRRVWKTLESTGIAALGAFAVSGCDAPENDSAAAAADSAAEPMVHSSPTAATGSSAAGEGAGGEGAGGEGEGVSEVASLLTDDAAYLSQIGLMRGHLWVGHQLYMSGQNDMAATHMKHPQAEIYSTLTDAFVARGVSGFADELTALANAVESQAPTAEVQASYDSLTKAIAQNERDGADTQSASIAADVIVSLLRTAGEEYAIGIVDSQVSNVHEYQDALGFTQIAIAWAKSPAFAGSPEEVAVAAKFQETLTSLLDQWPSLAPEGEVPFKADRIYGAAARLELDTLALKAR